MKVNLNQVIMYVYRIERFIYDSWSGYDTRQDNTIELITAYCYHFIKNYSS